MKNKNKNIKLSDWMNSVSPEAEDRWSRPWAPKAGCAAACLVRSRGQPGAVVICIIIVLTCSTQWFAFHRQLTTASDGSAASSLLPGCSRGGVQLIDSLAHALIKYLGPQSLPAILMKQTKSPGCRRSVEGWAFNNEQGPHLPGETPVSYSSPWVGQRHHRNQNKTKTKSEKSPVSLPLHSKHRSHSVELVTSIQRLIFLD